MKTRLTRRMKIGVVLTLALLTILTATAFAISNITLLTGTLASYNFGGYGPGYPVPALVQIQVFRMNPGETVPWHYHKGTSYVILAHGSLTEQHVVGQGQCESEDEAAGSAFIEEPGEVHSVTNSGKDVAVIWWATLFPKSDGGGGIYFADAPSCQ